MSLESGAPMLDICLSIVSHGHGELVLALLGQLGELHERPRRVIVTFNRHEPGWPERLQQRTWPFELMIQRNAEPKGFGANHNAAFHRDGLQRACSVFGVLNPDVRLLENPFPALLAALALDTRTGCVYPLQLDAHGQRQDHERRLPTPWRLLQRTLGARQEVPADALPDWVNAAFVCLPRPVFQSVRGFDERYRMYCEDVDLCLRLRLAGWRLQRVPVAVEHQAARASHRQWRHLYWHVASLLRLWRSDAYRLYRERCGA